MTSRSSFTFQSVVRVNALSLLIWAQICFSRLPARYHSDVFRAAVARDILAQHDEVLLSMQTLPTSQPHIHTIVCSVGITGDLSHPVLGFHEVTFGYSPDAILYRHLDFGLDLKSRIALVC